MDRLILTLAIVAFFALCVWGMRLGWRRKARSQSVLVPPFPEVPEYPGELVLPVKPLGWMHGDAARRTLERRGATVETGVRVEDLNDLAADADDDEATELVNAEPFAFDLDEDAYDHLRGRAEALLGVPLPRIRRRWAGVYSEVEPALAGRALYHRAEVEPGVVLVTGPGGRGMTCSPAIAEETFTS